MVLKNNKVGERSMKIVVIATLIIAVTSGMSNAQLQTNALGECMAQQTSGADREHFAKWIFSVLALHPVAEPLANVSDGERERIDSQMAMLVTRLIAEDCMEEAKVALNRDEQEFINAFRLMGEIAVQELFRDQGVNQASENYIKYLDDENFSFLFE
jgi:hypothetical protein